jgi:uncharacterized membrane protein
VLLAGVLVHRPLSRVPENTMKFAVGAMLTTFGMFWAGEGAGVHWPLGDATIIVLLALTVGATGAMVLWLRLRRERSPLEAEPASA